MFLISKYPLLLVTVNEIRAESLLRTTDMVASLSGVAETESCKVPFATPLTFCAYDVRLRRKIAKAAK